MSQHHRFEHRPCTLESSIKPGYMISFQVYLLHCCFILSLYFYNNVLHLTSIWLEYHFFFLGTCVFANKFGGMICSTSAHSGIPILLRLCSILYTHWGQCVIQVWGYGRTKHCPIFCYVIAKNLVELKF
jgi:lysylphosphatidylglycerol synthetase-like protein (DUF2156 family)